MKRGSVVAITGASSGIGEAAAEAFARRGGRLVLGARREELLEEVAGRLAQRYGSEVAVVRCDVRDERDVQALVGAALTRFGQLDVLVANAGIGFYGRVEETTADEFRALIETNLLGVHNAIRAAVPAMRRQGSGHIAAVGSVSGKRGWPFHGAYSATKFALAGLVQALRSELAGSGVTASLVLPGSTRTQFFTRAPSIVPGLEPRPTGLVQSAAQVAEKIVRSVDHPGPELNTVPVMRLAWVVCEALPFLPDFVAKRYYSRVATRLGLAGSGRATGEADAAANSAGSP
jgi:short-subunit dehydrogenase